MNTSKLNKKTSRHSIMNNLSNGHESAVTRSSKAVCPENFITDERWAVILAGGDGTRLLSITRRLSGDERPKQFCRIIGGDTLLDETRRRVAYSFQQTKTMFVLTRKHERYYNAVLAGVPLRNLVVQARNAGTAPAILYSLLRLGRSSPTASVAFFPSDHYFSDDKAFMAEVESAFITARALPDSIVLLGIEPDAPDEEYGWIEPDTAKSSGEISNARPVRRFWEKPSRTLARELMDRGCLWNSFVMVGTVSAFLKTIHRAVPELFVRFATVRAELCTSREEKALQILYNALPDANFSKDVLGKRPEDLAVIRVSGSKWSDLGSLHRVLSMLSHKRGLTKDGPRGNLVVFPESLYEQANVSRRQTA